MIEAASTPNRKPKFGRSQMLRLSRLLNMRYTPAEIAREIGVSVDTVYRSYIPAGCPAEQGPDRRIWIVGTEFRNWVLSLQTHKQTHPACAEPGVGWCFHCAKPVRVVNASIHPVNYYLERLQGACEYCGKVVNRLQAVDAQQGEGA
jgi:hypothetical protein